MDGHRANSGCIGEQSRAADDLIDPDIIGRLAGGADRLVLPGQYEGIALRVGQGGDPLVAVAVLRVVVDFREWAQGSSPLPIPP
jgi:hypothetical protein